MVDRLMGYLPGVPPAKIAATTVSISSSAVIAVAIFSQHDCGLSSKACILGESHRFSDHRSTGHRGRCDLRSFTSSAIGTLAVVAYATIV
jgi:hypothetical protein